MRFLPSDWINPFYANILHGNYATGVLDDAARVEFNQAVHRTLKGITETQITNLIGASWREAITGSWFAGVAGFSGCCDQIGSRLVQSESCFAGQAHALCLGVLRYRQVGSLFGTLLRRLFEANGVRL